MIKRVLAHFVLLFSAAALCISARGDEGVLLNLEPDRRLLSSEAYSLPFSADERAVRSLELEDADGGVRLVLTKRHLNKDRIVLLGRAGETGAEDSLELSPNGGLSWMPMQRQDEHFELMLDPPRGTLYDVRVRLSSEENETVFLQERPFYVLAMERGLRKPLRDFVAGMVKETREESGAEIRFLVKRVIPKGRRWIEMRGYWEVCRDPGAPEESGAWESGEGWFVLDRGGDGLTVADYQTLKGLGWREWV